MTQPRPARFFLIAVTGLLVLGACNDSPVTPPGPGPKATLTLNGVTEGQTISGTSVNVTASVDGAEPDAVTFTLDGQLVVKRVTAPYSFGYDKLSNRQHGLTVTATLGTKTLVSKDVLFTSQGAPTTLDTSNITGSVCSRTLMNAITVMPTLGGATPDEVIYTVTRNGGNSFVGRDSQTFTLAPYSYRLTPGTIVSLDDFNDKAVPNPQYTLSVRVANRNFPHGTLTDQVPLFSCTFTVPTSTRAKPLAEYFDEMNPPSGAYNWQTTLDNSTDTYQFANITWGAQNDKPGTVAQVHSTRGPTSTNSRFALTLDKPLLDGNAFLTDKNTFQFWMVFRVTGRSSEPNEWKVGRVGLVSTSNATPSEGGAVKNPNNNINSVQFEIEAQYNYVTGFFAMINLGGLPDCQNTQDPTCARRDTKRISFDPSVAADDQTQPTTAFNKWMKVTCTYTGDGGNVITGLPNRSFTCNGRNDEDNIDLGSTGTIQLQAAEHFNVDAFGLFSSGRPTGTGSTSLDWEAGRTLLTVWQ